MLDSTLSPPGAVASVLPERLVLYDGVCRFCNRTVAWLLRVDTEGLFRFAPLQGPTAAALRARHPELPSDLDSILYVRRQGATEHVTWRSAAVLAICRDLPGAWRWLAALRWLPAPLIDAGYRYFASHRYAWFGKYEQCPLPSAEQRARFFD